MSALQLVSGLLNLQIYATVQRGFIQLAQLIQRQTSLSGRLDWRAGDLESINAGNTSFVQSFVSTITVYAGHSEGARRLIPNVSMIFVIP